MQLTAEFIQECQERERAWCNAPRTRLEEQQTVAFLESIQDRQIVVPNWHVPAEITTLIESVTTGHAPASVPASGRQPQILSEYRPAVPDDAREGDDRHARLAAALRSPADTAPRVLTEHRGDARGTRDVASLSYEERFGLLQAFVRGEDNPLHKELRPVIQEQRTEAPVLRPGAHRLLAEAIRGAEPVVPAGTHERLAAAIRGRS